MRYMPAIEHTATLVSFRLSSSCKALLLYSQQSFAVLAYFTFVLGDQADDGRCIIKLDLRAREAVRGARAFLLECIRAVSVNRGDDAPVDGLVGQAEARAVAHG